VGSEEIGVSMSPVLSISTISSRSRRDQVFFCTYALLQPPAVSTASLGVDFQIVCTKTWNMQATYPSWFAGEGDFMYVRDSVCLGVRILTMEVSKSVRRAQLSCCWMDGQAGTVLFSHPAAFPCICFFPDPRIATLCHQDS
jgi:hypothetical protein